MHLPLDRAAYSMSVAVLCTRRAAKRWAAVCHAAADSMLASAPVLLIAFSIVSACGSTSGRAANRQP